MYDGPPPPAPAPPAAPYAIRLPLQIGISSLWSIARFSASFVPSVLAIVLGASALFAGRRMS